MSFRGRGRAKRRMGGDFYQGDPDSFNSFGQGQGALFVSNEAGQSFTRFKNYVGRGQRGSGNSSRDISFTDDNYEGGFGYGNFDQSEYNPPPTWNGPKNPPTSLLDMDIPNPMQKQKLGFQTARPDYQPQRGYQGVPGVDKTRYDGGNSAGDFYQSEEMGQYRNQGPPQQQAGNYSEFDETGYDWGSYQNFADPEPVVMNQRLKAFAGYGPGAGLSSGMGPGPDFSYTGQPRPLIDIGHEGPEFYPPGGRGRYPAAPGDFGTFHAPLDNQPAVPDNQFFTMFFGIEEIPPTEEDEMDEDLEETIEFQNHAVKKLKVDNGPYGQWQTVGGGGEEEEDSLTRDARIIAGVADEKPQDPSFVSLASEIEITVPAEMITQEYCKLCEARFTAPDSARMHYMGKKHAQKENQYVRKIYQEKGINVTRFLPKIKSTPTAPQISKKKARINRKKFRFTCFLCKVSFENEPQVRMHTVSAPHRKRVFDYQTELIEKHGPYAGQQAARMKQSQMDRVKKSKKKKGANNGGLGDFYCYLCDKVMNSEEQYQLHVESRKHQNKEEESGGYY